MTEKSLILKDVSSCKMSGLLWATRRLLNFHFSACCGRSSSMLAADSGHILSQKLLVSHHSQSLYCSDRDVYRSLSTCARNLNVNQGVPGQCADKSDLPHSIGAYNNVIIHTSHILKSVKVLHSAAVEDFVEALRESLKKWAVNSHNAVWLHIDVAHCGLIAMAAELGFELHHASKETVVMTCWLNTNKANRIPPYASHQVGVCGCVIRPDTNEVLVTKDRHKLPIWKFPGGLSDHAEDMADTAVREVKEETGIDAKFKSILAFRQQHHQPNTFDRSDMYVICRLEAQSYEISMCEHEVLACRWMSLQGLLRAEDTTVLSRQLATLLLQGLRDGYDTIDITMRQFNSVYPGLTYKLFHRALESELVKP